MLAFHSDLKIKTKYLRRVKAHRRAEAIMQGFGYYGKGEAGKMKMCAVGCTIHSGDHGAYERELGIPRVLARLEDCIFERLPHDEAMVWPLDFLSAIGVGADLSMVWPQFAHWLLVDLEDGVIRFAKTDKTRAAILAVANLYARWIAGDKPAQEEWVSARAAAYADAAAAAYADAAAYAAAAAAAYAAATTTATAYAAADAAATTTATAAAAADAADADAAAARKLSVVRQSQKLLEVIGNAPVARKGAKESEAALALAAQEGGVK